MISFRIKGCAVRFYFSFFVFNALIFILRDNRLMLAFYTACAVHESGHMMAILLCGGRIRAVELSGAGIRIVMRKGGIVPVRSSLFVLLAGPAANIIVFLTVKLAGCNGAFPLLDLTAAVYNMLPYSSLDGGAVIALLTAGTSVLIRIYTQSASDGNMMFPTAIFIFAFLAGILLSVKTYRKKMEACDNLIDSLESE